LAKKRPKIGKILGFDKNPINALYVQILGHLDQGDPKKFGQSLKKVLTNLVGNYLLISGSASRKLPAPTPAPAPSHLHPPPPPSPPAPTSSPILAIFKTNLLGVVHVTKIAQSSGG
jgi:hypothetical protein